MTQLRQAPYGFWMSPITSDWIVAETVSLGEVRLDGPDTYWLEGRPAEGGRYVVMKRTPDGQTMDLLPQPFNARTRVHEYGGGAYAVADGNVYFANFADQRLYRLKAGQPEPITPELKMRYADGVIDRGRRRLLCVREDHSTPGQVVNTLAAVDLTGARADQVLAAGNDFYSSPALSRDGKRLTWLTWNHPNMPWTGTELWVADLAPDGAPLRPQRVAGDPQESIFQPQWSPDGDALFFVSDRSGWWNLYRWVSGGTAECLAPMEAEFGRPQWVFGMSTYAFESDQRLFCAFCEKGSWGLATIDLTSTPPRFDRIPTPFGDISDVRATLGKVVFRAGSPTDPAAIVELTPATGLIQVLRRTNQQPIEGSLRRFLSPAQPVEFPTGRPEAGQTAHGFFYPPVNPDNQAPPGTLPPLLVKTHGGPTSAVTSTLDLRTQYWTSRGIAVLDVNYGGSTGYGRAYRERLDGQWGVVDVEDCVNGAKFLAAKGQVDGERLVIDGGSAGGYTTLCVLTFRNDFKSGASYYGVSDLEALGADTHKFEAHYLDSLIGPYPECQALYRERSPIHSADRLSVPVIFFQGDEDLIVPPNQTELMVEALRAKGVPVGYLLLTGEQHGFRRSENIKRALDMELAFYAFLVFRTGLCF